MWISTLIFNKDYIATLKSKLYQGIKQGVKTLTEQFKGCIGNDWTQALRESGKTFKNFKKDLLRKFHPDVNGGSEKATKITQTINEWEELEYQMYEEVLAYEQEEEDYIRCRYSIPLDEELVREGNGAVNETFYRKVNKYEWDGLSYIEIYQELSKRWAEEEVAATTSS